MNGLSINFKKAVIELLLLGLLKGHDMYGYQLGQELKKRSSGKLFVLDGSMYAILSRLTDAGFLVSRTEAAGPKRCHIIYHMTDSGLQYYNEGLNEYKDCVKTTNDLLSI